VIVLLVQNPKLLYATAMLLKLDIRAIEPDITAVVLGGKITLGRESQQIETSVKDLLGEGHKNIILDLSGITYVDSTGLGIVTFCSSHVTQAGGKFAVAGATGLPAKLFQMTRLDTIIRLYPSLEAACQAIAAAPSQTGA
jgi:anti-sigma B factor antagonist